MRKFLLSFGLWVLFVLVPVHAQYFSIEVGYQLQPVKSPYLMLRYNYPLAQINLGSGIYAWLLPEIGILPNNFYWRTQLLLETKLFTIGTDFKQDKETILRVFVRTEF